MVKLRSAAAAVGLLSGLCLCGCDKEVKLTFLNLSEDTLDVHVTSPDKGRQYLGVLPPMGKLRHRLAIDEKGLPAACLWTAGPYVQQFSVTRETAGLMFIDIRPPAPPPIPAKGTSGSP
jgi:hypothetical protein